VRRRLLAAILATVVLALVLSGTGTYLLLRREGVRTIDSSLRAEATTVAGLVSASQDPSVRIAQSKVVSGLRLEGIGVLVRLPDGELRGERPEGVREQDVPTEELQPGDERSGRRPGIFWASATVAGTRGSVVTVVLTREASPPRAPVGWFVLGGGVALLVGAAVAGWLSGTLTRPLRQAQEATRKVSQGDLSVRLPEPPPGAEDELAELTRSINAMAAALGDGRRLERHFLLSVSHDLRTPLTSIRGYADAITDGTIADPLDAARVISAESQRLGRLVGDLLDLARLDAHEFSLDLQPVPIGEVVVEAAEGFRPTAEEVGVSLTVQVPTDPAMAVVDPDRLIQALGNLLENGLKHALSALWVEASTSEQGAVTITVIDDGPGIAPRDLPNVFERLYVTDRRPRRQVGGTGLGLAIVRELVHAMGGRTWVESPALPDELGARFVIALPPVVAPTSIPAPTSATNETGA
jgi:two-component system sensor histidine kinase BaeS